MKLSIVIPAYNEEDGIGPTLNTIPTKELQDAGYEVEKLVVDNASTDRTSEVARQHGARVVYQPKRGYGNAYKFGIQHATGDIIATGDADMTYPFDALPAILAKMKIDDLEFVNGERLSELRPGVMHRSHVFGNRVLSVIMFVLFRTPFTDSQSGMWVFDRSIWEQLDVRHGGMPFSQEIKIEAFAKGYRCAEVPIEYRKRVGDVKLSLHDAWLNISELFKKRLVLEKARAADTEG
jgi:glycosyltransferase involved in cell wall biosynthesis